MAHGLYKFVYPSPDYKVVHFVVGVNVSTNLYTLNYNAVQKIFFTTESLEVSNIRRQTFLSPHILVVILPH